MSGVLVIAEHRQGDIRDVTYELIAAAVALSDQGAGPVSVLVVGADAARLGGGLGCSGVDTVIAAPAPAAEFDPKLTEAAVAAAIEQHDPVAILAGHTVDGSGFAPAVAVRCGLGFASNVISAAFEDGSLRARRGAFGDRLVAQLDFDDARVLLMMRPGVSAPAAPGDGAPVTELTVQYGVPTTEHHGFRGSGSDDVDITKSPLLLSIGRGIGEEDQVERFSALADKLGATLSASRPLVDAGWISNSRQVGQSGRTVKPRVYLALGISGAVQHLAGIREADTVIAVNTDPEAPIFSVADYGAVIDLHDLADALEHTL